MLVDWSYFLIGILSFIFIIYIYIREISWRPGCLHVDTQSPIKGIDIEGCKIPMAWAMKQKEHKAVKQHSGPTIYLGKDNES